MVGRIGVVLLAIAPLGCFIPSGVDFDDFSSTLPSTGEFPWPDTLTATTLPATDSVTSTTFADTSGDGSSGTETETDTEGSASVCDPQPEEVQVGVLFDGTPSFEHPHTELLTQCVVTFVANFGPAVHLGLACEDGGHTLDVADIGPLDVDVGDEVELSVYIDVPWWSNVYVALRRNGELVLAAMDADSLPDGSEGHPAEDFFAPLGLAVLHDVCPIEPPADDEPCNFVCPAPCTRDRRLALAFVEEGGAEVVFDNGTGQLDDLALVVGDAREHVEVFCADTPGWRFQVVALRG